jgi:hypothetical protein
MLERDLDRIAHKLSIGIVTAFRQASIDELAELIPAVRRLVKEAERAAAAEKKAAARPAPARIERGRAAPPGARSVRGQPPRSERAGRTGDGPRSSRGGERSLAEALLRALASKPDGLRSEEIQQEVPATARELRIAITELLGTGQVVRRGQARGTRYSLANAVAPASVKQPKASPPREPRVIPPHKPRVAREPREPGPSMLPAIEVSNDMINGIRAHLSNSVKPMSIGELEEIAKLDRQVLRAALEKMIELNLADREGQGPALRYRLATPSSGEGGTELSGGTRVVRRPPRAKNWQPSAQPPAPTVGASPTPTGPTGESGEPSPA